MRTLRTDKEKKEMTNDIRKMNEQELNQVAGGIDGFCGLDPDGGAITGMMPAMKSVSFTTATASKSSAIPQMRTTILTAPASHGIHGSTPRDSIRADG